jgi:hypothetical protein
MRNVRGVMVDPTTAVLMVIVGTLGYVALVGLVIVLAGGAWP